MVFVFFEINEEKEKNKRKERSKQKKYFTTSCVENTLKIIGIFQNQNSFDERRRIKPSYTQRINRRSSKRNSYKNARGPAIPNKWWIWRHGSVSFCEVFHSIYNINTHTERAPKNNCANATPLCMGQGELEPWQAGTQQSERDSTKGRKRTMKKAEIEIQYLFAVKLSTEHEIVCISFSVVLVLPERVFYILLCCRSLYSNNFKMIIMMMMRMVLKEFKALRRCFYGWILVFFIIFGFVVI